MACPITTPRASDEKSKDGSCAVNASHAECMRSSPHFTASAKVMSDKVRYWCTELSARDCLLHGVAAKKKNPALHVTGASKDRSSPRVFLVPRLVGEASPEPRGSVKTTQIFLSTTGAFGR